MRWFFLFSFFILSDIPSLWAQSKAYGGREPEICFKDLTSSERKRREIEVVLESYDALLKSFDDPKGIWDQAFLKSHPDYLFALQDYTKGKRGQMAKATDLTSLTPEEIHQKLLDAGFVHKREILHPKFKDTKGWVKDQDMPARDRAPQGVMMDTYTHKDGSRIRVKPSSIPDYSRRTPLRLPHYSKSVMLDLKNLEGGYDQEAFKLTKGGQPVPRAPSVEVGYRPIYTEDENFKRRLQADVVMGAVHFLLPSTCVFGNGRKKGS